MYVYFWVGSFASLLYVFVCFVWGFERRNNEKITVTRFFIHLDYTNYFYAFI